MRIKTVLLCMVFLRSVGTLWLLVNRSDQFCDVEYPNVSQKLFNVVKLFTYMIQGFADMQEPKRVQPKYEINVYRDVMFSTT